MKTNIGALRQQLIDDVRIHGIIIDGGTVVNSISQRSTLRIEMRVIPIAETIQSGSTDIANLSQVVPSIRILK
ncbi:hypothetical protein [Sedimentibacter sp. B4]|uniref:hypothetical protein n=1 Tax=Sedimentibacter sp. B4 TaxID=304766 RepID=UPI0002E61941|nr:hypothetical protein [Sedimentibacter sp. B4]